MSEFRVRIDAIDDRLLELLNERAQVAKEVAEVKSRDGASFYVPGRERAIIDRLQGANSGPFPNRAIRPVFQEVISACLSLEEGLSIAYLGPEATFTHQAVKRHFGTSAQGLPCGSIPAAFEAVERGQARYAVVPVENSSEGAVSHTLDCFIDSPLSICAEIVVEVAHCLLAGPDVEMAAIERVYSHAQAFGQCRQWIDSHLPRVDLVQTSSTAEAARVALEDEAGAAIGAELAAHLYGLRVLRRAIQDADDNVTRFLVVGEADESPPNPNIEYKTSVMLAMPDRAGCLSHVLTPLADASINLTKIESRPSRRRAWAYVFFLDLDGHKSAPGVAEVLAEIGSACEMFRVLGSYPKADPT